METNIGVALRKRSENSPDLEAFVDTDTGQRISYSQLNDYSNQCASSLVGMGIAMGDRIALLLPNGLEFVGLFYAAAKLGVVVVPLNTRLTPSELAFILQDSAPKALFFGDAFAATAAELRAGGDGKAIVEHWIESAPSSIDVTVSGKNSFLQNLLSAVVAEEPMDVGAGNDDNLFIMYTSGTTGAPKGVVHSHQSMMWSCLCWMASIDVRYRDRLLLPLPMFHVAALTTVIFSMLRGVTLVSMPVFDPSRMWDLLQEEEITIAGAVPAMLNFMLQVPGHERKNTDHLRAFISGAAPLPETIIERYQQLGIQVMQGYALTESAGGGSMLSEEYALSRIGSAGKPMLFTDICVVDDKGEKHSRGTGEIWMRAKHMMKEYWNRPDATAEAFEGDWFKTGDIAEIDEEGFIYIKDRIKDMIISGGENVYPAEVEAVIQTHPAVREVAVIGQADDKWGETVHAVIVASREDLSEQAILDHCEGELSRYKQPRIVSFVEELPRNASGKVLKRELKLRFENGCGV